MAKCTNRKKIVITSAVWTETGQQFKTNVSFDAHGTSVNLEDVRSAFQIGQTEFNFTI